jgi:hypothetical protein
VALNVVATAVTNCRPGRYSVATDVGVVLRWLHPGRVSAVTSDVIIVDDGVVGAAWISHGDLQGQ